MSEGKTVPVKVRVAWDELTTLNNLCVANGWKQADAIRMAIHGFNIKKTKELKTNQTWSPVQEYNLQNEPGQGYDQTKQRWNPELKIASYQDKVQARQRKLQETD